MTIDPANIRSTGPAITGVANTDTPTEPVFANKAPQMHRAGFAVVPAYGKEPIRKRYRNWRHAPGAETVARWGEKHHDADIVYVPGLSRAKRGGAAMIVVGADDGLACEQVVAVVAAWCSHQRDRSSTFTRNGCDETGILKVESACSRSAA